MESVLYFTNTKIASVPDSWKLSLPRYGISLASIGSLKPREDALRRNAFFSSVGIDPNLVISLSQTHSKIIHIAKDTAEFISFPEGDGILTKNPNLVPSVTVADCMPVYLFNPVVGCFGVLHSGWKGTGIIGEALESAKKEWNAQASDFYILFGPHIHSCCYTVDLERAEYFQYHFSKNSVVLDSIRVAEGNLWPYRLSLVEANKQLCISLGIPEAQIHDSGFCTCCNDIFGSNRRQGAGKFTQMTAFVSIPS